jgi:hypothetical protein
MEKVYVEWSDSNMYRGQFDKSEAFEIACMGTVGYLLKKTRHEVIVARDEVVTSEITEYRDVIVIPKVNVTGIYRLQQKR